MIKRLVAIFALAACVTAIPGANAQTFDDQLEAALSHWRAATWYARTGDTGVAGLELDEFRDSWTALAGPPPAQIQAWEETKRLVATAADMAAQSLGRDDGPGSAKALREIGDALAAWRKQNGIVGYSDRVASYREEIDRISLLVPNERADVTALTPLRMAAQNVLSAALRLAEDKPARWRDRPQFETLVQQNIDGANALLAALQRPEAPSALEVVGLIRVVRSNYNLLFLHFGARGAFAPPIG